jgi:type IV secretory pathway VirB10-like protein
VKKQLYERVFRTPEYYLFNTDNKGLIAYHLVNGFYQQMEPDAQGRYYSAQTDLYLVIHEGWLRWMTKTGEILPTPKEKAEQEKQRADRAEQMAEQERQRADQEKQRADQEKQRADQEKQRAEQEAAARRHTEELLEEYRRRLGELK